MVGQWVVNQFFEVDAGASRSSISLETGEKVYPVLVVVDANCRQLLETNAYKLVQYAEGACAKNFGKATETSDSENAMTESKYEKLLEKKSQNAFGRNTLGATKGNKAVPSKVRRSKTEEKNLLKILYSV
jgi:hypothetical protein